MRARYRLCKHCGELHSLAEWPANHRDPAPQHSMLASPMVIRDQMDELLHPSDGHKYDSKSEFRRVTEAHGGIEIGTDEQKDMRYYDTVTTADVAQAYHQVEQGYVPRPADYDPVIDG